MLSRRQRAPQPTVSFGYEVTKGSFLVPRIRAAFIFSPYIYASFPSTIPHCINKEQLPVTKGVAMEVPLLVSYPPPGAHEVIFTPGATRSGFT